MGRRLLRGPFSRWDGIAPLVRLTRFPGTTDRAGVRQDLLPDSDSFQHEAPSQ
jgi:hypothetical protein